MCLGSVNLEDDRNKHWKAGINKLSGYFLSVTLLGMALPTPGHADPPSLDEKCLAEFGLSISGIGTGSLDGAKLRTWLKNKFSPTDTQTLFDLIDQDDEGHCAFIQIGRDVPLNRIQYYIVVHHRHAWIEGAAPHIRKSWTIRPNEFALFRRGQEPEIFKSSR